MCAALPVLQLHARALLPQGNFFKALQTKWRLFQAVLKASSQPEQAAQLQDKLLSEVRRRWCGRVFVCGTQSLHGTQYGTQRQLDQALDTHGTVHSTVTQ